MLGRPRAARPSKLPRHWSVMSDLRDLPALVRKANEGWLERPEARLLVCFSHLRWNFVYQRPQHILTRAAKDHLVVYFEEPGFGVQAAPTLQFKLHASGVLVALPMLPDGTVGDAIEDALRALVDSLLREFEAIAPRAHKTFWYYTPMALGFSDPDAADLCVYDCMDELSAFRNAPPRLIERERALLGRADLVFAGGQSLHEAKQAQGADVHLFPSSIEKEHFGKARTAGGESPPDQAAIARPRIGYFGVIDERLNADLVREIADLEPEWQIVMIGPAVKIDPKDLPQRPNIHWLGGKAYSELPSYLAGWDLGMMPFALNESTRFISPTKTPEFLAAGLQVISTPIRDVVRPYGELGLVAIAEDARSFVAAARQLLGHDKAEWLRAADAFLARISWDDTYAGMRKLMLEAGRARSGAA